MSENWCKGSHIFTKPKLVYTLASTWLGEIKISMALYKFCIIIIINIIKIFFVVSKAYCIGLIVLFLSFNLILICVDGIVLFS